MTFTRRFPLRRRFAAALMITTAAFVASEALSRAPEENTPAAATQSGVPELGPNARLNGYRPFPAYDPWNRAVDKEPVDPDSAAIIARIGAKKSLQVDFGANFAGGPFGIPYVVVAGTQPGAAITFQNARQSDPGPYPIPRDAPFEQGPVTERRLLVLDRDNQRLYETRQLFPLQVGWRAESGAIFDLRAGTLRPLEWVSADDAGMPIFPGLVRFDEVAEQKEIRHALRFTVTQTRRAFVPPARRAVGDLKDRNLPPLGMRVRLKAGVDISGFAPQARVVAQALKTYGMFLADTGGDWFLSGAPDARWDDADLSALQRLQGSDFEVVKMPPVIVK